MNLIPSTDIRMQEQEYVCNAYSKSNWYLKFDVCYRLQNKLFISLQLVQPIVLVVL